MSSGKPYRRGLRVCGVIAVLATSALAAPLPVTLIWQAPEGCPQQAEVWERLSERLGRVPWTPDGTSFAARGEVRQTETGWQVQLQTLSQSGPGTRELASGSCEDLTGLALVALSMAIDPLIEPPPDVAPRSLWLGIGPRTSVGFLPFPSAGLAANVVLDLLPASFEFALETSLAQRYPRDDGKALRVAVPLGGGLNACVGFARSRFSALGCAHFHGALMTGEAEGVASPRAGVAAFLALGPRLEVRVVLHARVALRLTVDGSVALLRPSFFFANAVDAYTAPLFSGAGALTIEFRVW